MVESLLRSRSATFGTGGIGCEISLDGLHDAASAEINEAAALFGESATRAVVSARPSKVTEVLLLAAAAGVPAG